MITKKKEIEITSAIKRFIDNGYSVNSMPLKENVLIVATK